MRFRSDVQNKTNRGFAITVKQLQYGCGRRATISDSSPMVYIESPFYKSNQRHSGFDCTYVIRGPPMKRLRMEFGTMFSFTPSWVSLLKRSSGVIRRTSITYWFGARLVDSHEWISCWILILIIILIIIILLSGFSLVFIDFKRFDLWEAALTQSHVSKSFFNITYNFYISSILSCSLNFLEVRDGSSAFSPLIEKFCVGKDLYTLRSTGSALHIRYVNQRYAVGFSANITEGNSFSAFVINPNIEKIFFKNFTH